MCTLLVKVKSLIVREDVFKTNGFFNYIFHRLDFGYIRDKDVNGGFYGKCVLCHPVLSQ